MKILKEEHNADIDEKIKVALLTSMLPFGWGERNSGEQYDDDENPEEDDSSINYVGGKSGGKHGKGGKGFGKSKGKGFQGYCYTCGELGHTARECPKGKGKGEFGLVIGTKAATRKAMAREQARGRGLAFSAAHWITS